MIDHIPPQTIEAEQSVLGSILQNQESLDAVIPILEPEDFYVPKHQRIYQAIRDLYSTGQVVDLITVPNKLAAGLEGTGGRRYLFDLTEAVVNFLNVETHAKTIKDKAILRRVIGLGAEIGERSYHPDANADSVLTLAEEKLFRLADRRSKNPIVHISTFSSAVLDGLNTHEWGIRSGIVDLDKLTYGFHDGELTIIAGRPSTGKTAFALNIAEHATIMEHRSVLIDSIEMSKESLYKRLLFCRSRVRGERSRGGAKITDVEWDRLRITAPEIAESPIYIDDSADMNILEIRSRARRHKMKMDTGMIILDYLQLVQGPKGESRNQEVTFISQQLKAMAKELKIPVVALSQLSRRVEQRGKDARPNLADLRESGSIEQDADLVLFIHREKEKNGEMGSETEIIIGKQRNGPMGIVKATYLKDITRFENWVGEQ